jgi:hypothetical protein
MKNEIVLILALTLFLLTCKKDNPDPFFDGLPKTYVFKSIEEISPPRMFVNGTEIFDGQAIAEFIDAFLYFDDISTVEIGFKNEKFTFVDNSFVKYTGTYYLFYDSVFYKKSGDILYLESELKFDKDPELINTIYNHEYYKWPLDSIDYYFDTEKDLHVYLCLTSFQCTVSEDEMVIPVLVSAYAPWDWLGPGHIIYNAFNENCLPNITMNKLAIWELRMRLKRE